MRSIIYSLYMRLRLCIILVVFHMGLNVNVMTITLQFSRDHPYPWKNRDIYLYKVQKNVENEDNYQIHVCIQLLHYQKCWLYTVEAV